MLTETEVKGMFKHLAVDMLEKIKNEYNNSGKYWENLGDANDKESEKYRLEELSTTDLSNVEDEKLAEYLEKLENAFLYTISRLPWKDRDGNCHYPVGENKVTKEKLAAIVKAMNGDSNDNVENFFDILVDQKNKKKFPDEIANLKYAFPQCVKGNITNSKIYHCLLNPGSSVEDKTALELGIEDSFEGYYKDLGKKDHKRIEDKEHKYELELAVEYINDFKKNLLTAEFEDFIEQYGNCNISKDKVDEIFSGKGEKEFHYIMEYYKTLVAKGIGDFRKILKKNLSNLGTLSSNLNDVKLCNLELIPVRSQDGATIGNLIDKIPFAVNIILRRIYIAELKNELEKPIFVFRSYYSTKNENDVRWQDAFKRKTDNYDGLYEYLINNYFLTHSGTQGGAYSKNNIVTISQEGRKAPKFKVEDYKDSGKTKGLENKIELASRAYKYINDTQNTFTSGLETE